VRLGTQNTSVNINLSVESATRTLNDYLLPRGRGGRYQPAEAGAGEKVHRHGFRSVENIRNPYERFCRACLLLYDTGAILPSPQSSDPVRSPASDSGGRQMRLNELRNWPRYRHDENDAQSQSGVLYDIGLALATFLFIAVLAQVIAVPID
jgi:hypothetical protein